MRTVRYHIDKQAELNPEKVYMFCPEPGRELTYRDLRRDSVDLACRLYEKGCTKGDKISFMMGNGYQTAKLFLGTMYAGLVASPLNLPSWSSCAFFTRLGEAGSLTFGLSVYIGQM